MYFGEDEILTPAKSLIGADYAFHSSERAVTYYHILLDQHSLVLANGMWAESLYLGSECMEMLSPRNRLEVFDAFPNVWANLGAYGRTARQQVRVREARLLMYVCCWRVGFCIDRAPRFHEVSRLPDLGDCDDDPRKNERHGYEWPWWS